MNGPALYAVQKMFTVGLQTTGGPRVDSDTVDYGREMKDTYSTKAPCPCMTLFNSSAQMEMSGSILPSMWKMYICFDKNGGLKIIATCFLQVDTEDDFDWLLS